jgi:hypothetical protein
MPGSSTIFGLIPCTNSRYLQSDKPRTITFDSEIVMGVDGRGQVQTVTALLHHFIPLGNAAPNDGVLYFVFGKVASMDSTVATG